MYAVNTIIEHALNSKKKKNPYCELPYTWCLSKIVHQIEQILIYGYSNCIIIITSTKFNFKFLTLFLSYMYKPHRISIDCIVTDIILNTVFVTHIFTLFLK